MPRFLRPNIGSRRPRLRTSAWAVGSSIPVIRSIWGFGSFFRQGASSDIDLLVVVSVNHDELLEALTQVRTLLRRRTSHWGIPIDMLLLTEREVQSRPLRDMHLLEPLFLRCTINRRRFW